MKEEQILKTVFLDSGEEESIDFADVIRNYKRYWKWFLFGVLFSLMIAFIYLKKSPSQYERTTTIFIDDKESGGLSSEITVFEDLGGLSGKKTSVINEIGVLKSLSLMESVVSSKKFNISFIDLASWKEHELYGNEVPIRINFFAADSVIQNLDTSFVVSSISSDSFTLKTEDGYNARKGVFGKNFNTSFGEINIIPAEAEMDFRGDLLVKIQPIRAVANVYLAKLEIEPQDKKSSLVELKITDPVSRKAEDLLNELVKQYNQDGINYKKMITQNTDRFINDRITDISLELSDVDRGVEAFKTTNELTDMEYEAGLVLSSDSEVDKKIVDLSTQLQLVDYVSDHIQNNKEDLIPANLGIQDNSTSQNTLDYNRLLLERNRIIKSSSKLNPTVVNLDAQIANLRQSIEQSLANFRSSLTFSLNEARNQKYRLSAKRRIAPQQEREFQDIKRKQQIIETLYLYLLEKREENAIALGMPVPLAKVIDRANGSAIPVSPVPIMTYLIAILTGLLLPFILISLIQLFDSKVHTIEEVEKIVRAPIMGDVPFYAKKKDYLISAEDQSGIAEAFRLLRTNLNFMIPKTDQGGSRSIFITSTLGGEGKTFISINLASVLTTYGKNVLWVGADLRKPRNEGYFKINNLPGLSEFLADGELTEGEVIQRSDEIPFDYLLAGQIPPNPTELLASKRFGQLMEYGKNHYDYVIVDTPPTGLVTDTLMMSEAADLFLYVIRVDYLEKSMLKKVKAIFDQKRLPNMAIIVNGTNDRERGYGYGYGSEKNSSWYRRVFKSAAF